MKCVLGNYMYVFGGCTSTCTTFNDLWKLDLSSRKWDRLLSMGSYPSPKACATLVYYKNSLVLFGGWTHPSPLPLHQVHFILMLKIFYRKIKLITQYFTKLDYNYLDLMIYDFNSLHLIILFNHFILLTFSVIYYLIFPF